MAVDNNQNVLLQKLTQLYSSKKADTPETIGNATSATKIELNGASEDGTVGEVGDGFESGQANADVQAALQAAVSGKQPAIKDALDDMNAFNLNDSTEVKTAEEALTGLKADVETANVNVANAEKDYSNKEKDITNLETQKTDLGNEIQEIKTGQLPAANNELSNAKSELSLLQADPDANPAAVNQAQNNVQKAQKTVDDINEQIKKKTEQVEELTQAIAQEKETLTKLAEKREDAQAHLKDTEKAYQDGLNNVDAAKQDIAEQVADATEQLLAAQEESNGNNNTNNIVNPFKAAKAKEIANTNFFATQPIQSNGPSWAD